MFLKILLNYKEIIFLMLNTATECPQYLGHKTFVFFLFLYTNQLIGY